MKTVIVTGGRNYSDNVMVDEVLDLIAPIQLVQGGATGADRLALEWAESRQTICVTVAADWSHGKKAGPMRNRAMLEKFPDAVVVAFPGGKGTADCVRQAIAMNRIVLEVK